ncbi:type I restriction enzyme S subunit [Paraburkholderia atlantica]|uniref:hypothetical protein n=1 Tax=Paraburkholderia atlantica TaxID=2654982 RepID=UPI003D1F9DE0
MTTQQANKVPQIRFKEFEAEWECETIGKILSEKRRPIALKDQQRYELITVKRRNEGIVSRGHLFGRDILVKNYSQLQAGDFVISKRQVVHGATGTIPPELDGAIVSNEYMLAVNNNRILTEFLAILASLPAMRRKFFLSSYGVDIEKLFFDAEDWKKRDITIPCTTEQTKIGGYFRELERLISLHQRKHDNLVKLKKAMLQKMFPQVGATGPEIRFNGFSGEWVEMTLRDVLLPYPSKPYIADSNQSGSFEVLQQGDNPISGYASGMPFQKFGDVILFGDHTLSLYRPTKPFFVASDGIKILGNRIGLFRDYLYSLLAAYMPPSEGYKRHLGILKSVRLPISLDHTEQQKIGTYFRTLDELISKHVTQFQKLEQIKSACLEKMFA